MRKQTRVARNLPLVGVLPQLLTDPAGLSIRAMRTTDDVVPLKLGPVTAFLVHHPEHLRHLLVDNYRNYAKGPLFAPVNLLVGDAMVLLEGEQWARQRRLLAPPFGAQRVRELAPAISEIVGQRLARWRGRSDPMDMSHEMSCITMAVLLRAILGISMDLRDVERVIACFEAMVGYLSVRGPLFFLPESIPLPRRRRALEAREELRRIIDGVVARRRAEPEGADDFIGYLLKARYEDGATMPLELIRDEVIAAVFAGYDTTATGLAFTLHAFASHPDTLREARGEIDAISPRGDIQADDLERLEYVRRAFLDSLRLHPPFSFHPRVALSDDRLGSQRIPAGATVLYSNAAAGRNPAFWQHPDTFNPDHFLPEQAARRHRFAFVPFGAGPRACIGRNLAVIEATVVLAMILRDYDLSRPLHPLVVRSRFGPSRARGGVWIAVKQRRAGNAGTS